MKTRDDDSPETVREQIHEGASFSLSYGLMNALAAVVASFGLLMNSTAVVIGAMIIAVLLGPIMGIALALVDGERKLLTTALLAEVGGAVLVLGIALLIGRIYHDTPFRSEVLSRTSSNIMDLIVALAGGAAGAYATLTPRINTGLVGVAVATALLPPLTVCGLSLARGEWKLGFGGFILYFTNLIAIQVSSSAVLALKGYHKILNPLEDEKSLLKRNWLSLLLLAALVVVLGLNLDQTISKQRWEANLRWQLTQALQSYEHAQLADVQFENREGQMEVYAVVYNTGSFRPDEVANIEKELKSPDGNRIKLHLQAVLIKETTRSGYQRLSPGADIEP